MKFNNLLVRQGLAATALTMLATLGGTASAATLTLSAASISGAPGLDLALDVSAGESVASLDFGNRSSGASAGSALTSIDFASGSASIAGHALDCANGGGCGAYVETAPVPVPAALPLLMGGLASLGFAGFRRRRA